MTLLVPTDELRVRRKVARGALAPLAQGLRRELEPVIASPPRVPAEKAMLTRAGGRCDRDGTLLSYDPFDARHRCPRCGRELHGAEHDRFRLYWHHLWLAERAVHGALLGTLLDDDACRALTADLLRQYAERYLHYPNRDNVLGPSRPFFSTYLESIWLLQLVVALDLLESDGSRAGVRELGARVRERIVVPSAALIASFDEGMSNRQVWNNAALLAVGRLLGDDALVERAIDGPSGLLSHLDAALLADGSWYEGENYHLFAHRGLWYGVQLAEQAGVALPAAHLDRFREGFAAPFRTILPDLTYPSRRDSQYAVSVRQPRFAESCELGLARGDDARLIGMLTRLYDPAVPRTATGRTASSADVERNGPATGLSRADLSWRSLLIARETLPELVADAPTSDLLPAQGFAILRREAGKVYAALDYGHTGGGHGHPDRLNVLLMDGDTRWFDDPGTGSYVDRSLHWYRSTLAHTAPLVDGRSQPRVPGTLVAFDDRKDAGWVSAEVELVPGLRIRRSLVVLEDYLVDRLEWTSDDEHEVALPLHGIDLVDPEGRPIARSAAPIDGGDGLEDGFAFLTRTARLQLPPGTTIHALGTRASVGGGAALHGWLRCDPNAEWWSARAPDVPGKSGDVEMLLVRSRGRAGAYVAVWSWRDAISDVRVEDASVRVVRRDGSVERHTPQAATWRIDRRSGGESRLVELAGAATAPPPSGSADTEELEEGAPIALPARFSLDERHYRRSEESWTDAGEPRAQISVATADDHALVISTAVEPSARAFVPAGAENPLDNEPAAINGDGLQIYLLCGEIGGAWLLVPDAASDGVAVQPIAGWKPGLTIEARWHATAAGYVLDARIPLPPECVTLSLDVLVNEIGPGRARRRGQLVLSGADREFVYLRGDRHDARRLLRFSRSDA